MLHRSAARQVGPSLQVHLVLVGEQQGQQAMTVTVVPSTSAPHLPALVPAEKLFEAVDSNLDPIFLAVLQSSSTGH